MGFIRTNLIPLILEAQRREFGGTCLLLGVPKVHLNREEFWRLLDALRLRCGRSAAAEAARQESHGNAWGYEELLRELGFERVLTLDVSDYEGASIVADLNQQIRDSSLEGVADLVIDHGTMEHVFDVRAVMANIGFLVRTEGRVFHSAPGSNFLDHGFYSLSPTFFHDFYSQNNWTIEEIQVFQTSADDRRRPPFYTPYIPGLLDEVSYGGLDGGMYGTICVATKTAIASTRVTPTQGRYRNLSGWSN